MENQEVKKKELPPLPKRTNNKNVDIEKKNETKSNKEEKNAMENKKEEKKEMENKNEKEEKTEEKRRTPPPAPKRKPTTPKETTTLTETSDSNMIILEKEGDKVNEIKIEKRKIRIKFQSYEKIETSKKPFIVKKF
jgi:hypothetical protein